MARHTLSVLVEDVPGTLTRVAGLFARRAFNIDSLAVGPTEVPGLSRMTVVVDAEGDLLEQVTKQLNKLINVIKIVELAPEASVQRDHVLIKVKADAATRLQVTQAADFFRARVVDVSPDAVVLEATGSTDKIEALLNVLEPFGIREIVQAGTLAHVPGFLHQPRDGLLRHAVAARNPVDQIGLLTVELSRIGCSGACDGLWLGHGQQDVFHLAGRIATHFSQADRSTVGQPAQDIGLQAVTQIGPTGQEQHGRDGHQAQQGQQVVTHMMDTIDHIGRDHSPGVPLWKRCHDSPFSAVTPTGSRSGRSA